jgi:hypothetical protein
VLLQGLKYFGRPGLEYGGPSGNDEINTAESDRILAEGLADRAFDTVAVDRLGRHAARDCYADTPVIQPIAARVYNEKAILTLLASANQLAKLATGADAAGSGETKLDLVRVQALKRARPLARRALRTLRPPFVAMRARKPCTRLRFSSLG